MHQAPRSKEARRIQWQTPSLYWKSKCFCLHFKVQNYVTFFPLTEREWRRTYCARVPFVGVLRLYRLCPAEWGGANHTHRVGWVQAQSPQSQYLNSYSGEVKTPGLFWLKVQFQYTHAKKVKSPMCYLPIPKIMRGRQGPSELRKGHCLHSFIPGHKWAGDTEQDRRHLLLMGAIGPVLTEFFWAQLKVVI